VGIIIDKTLVVRPKSAGLALIRYLVRIGNVEYTGEALEWIRIGLCDFEDIDNAILEGRLIKKERDKCSKDGKRYVIIGPDLAGYDLYCCGKVIETESGEMFLVITAHEHRRNFTSKGERNKNL
jgi:hypothetical protein